MLYMIPGLAGGFLLAGALSLTDYVLNATGRTTRRISRHSFLTIGILVWVGWSFICIVQGLEFGWGFIPQSMGQFIAWLGLSWGRNPAVRAGDHAPDTERR